MLPSPLQQEGEGVSPPPSGPAPFPVPNLDLDEKKLLASAQDFLPEYKKRRLEPDYAWICHLFRKRNATTKKEGGGEGGGGGGEEKEKETESEDEENEGNAQSFSTKEEAQKWLEETVSLLEGRMRRKSRSKKGILAAATTDWRTEYKIIIKVVAGIEYLTQQYGWQSYGPSFMQRVYNSSSSSISNSSASAAED